MAKKKTTKKTGKAKSLASTDRGQAILYQLRKKRRQRASS